MAKFFELVAKFFEQVTAKTVAPGSFETSVLDQILAMDCNGRETSSP